MSFITPAKPGVLYLTSFLVNCAQSANCNAGVPSQTYAALKMPEGALLVFRNGAIQFPDINYTITSDGATQSANFIDTIADGDKIQLAYMAEGFTGIL